MTDARPGPIIPPAPDPELPVIIRLADAQEFASDLAMLIDVGSRRAPELLAERGALVATRDRLVIAINDAVRKAKGRPT